MKLVFNVNNLNDKVIPNIQRNSKYLNSSYDILASISVPSDFEYRSRLISLPQKIKEVESKNRQIENWVNAKIGNLKSAEANNTNAMNRLSSSISRLNLGLNSKANNTGGKTTTTSKVTTSVKKAIDYAFSKKWILDASSLAKKTASKVASKIKSKIAWALSTRAKIVNKVKSVIVKKVSATLEFVGGKITSAWKTVSEKVFIPLGNVLKRTLASVANVVISLVKGLCEFIESLLDVIVMLGAGLASVVTGAWDGITYLASDNKEEWKSVTSKMWKETMGFVAEEHVENAYNAFFKETTVGQWLDENAFEAFKSDGVVCGVASGLGYVAGIIVLTIATLGVGTGAVAVSTTTTVATQATIATVAGIGKYTQESWAAKRDSSWEGIERMYQKGEISKEQLNSYVMIRELTDAEWAEIEQEYKNGLMSEEEYNTMKQIREMPNDWRTLENGLKGLGYGVANGVWEGVQWYVGGKLAGWTIKSGSQVASAAVRVGVDTGFNALDTPFRATVEALTSDKTWKEAWNDQGGAKSVLTNLIIGLIGSTGGEVFDLAKSKIKIKNKGNVIDDFNNKFPDSLDNGTRRLQNAQQVAEYFSDPKGFLASKFGVDDIRYMTDAEIYEYAKKNLRKEDFIDFKNLYANRRKFSQEEADLILVFAKSGGPAIDAYCRGVDVEFLGNTFNGGNYKAMNDYFKESVDYAGKHQTLINFNIDDAVRMLDNIVENSKPLTESLTVTRYVDDIFNNGERILNPQAGMIFNDKAFLSTSASGGVYGNRKMRLEIEVPAGSKVAYIEPEAIAHTGFKQQEVLLGRNNMYQVTDTRFDLNTGQYIVKAKMIPVKSNLQSIMDYDIARDNKLYYSSYNGKSKVKQIDLADVISDMKNKGLMAQCEAEIRDMKMSGIYSSAIAGHGEEHIEDVIFNAMYIAEKENFDDVEKKILIEAAKYHDAGKNVEGLLHGIQGAENAKDYLSSFSSDDIAIIQAAIEYHSIPDSDARLSEIFNKYNVASADRDMAERICNALKDADALDRCRYPGNLNENYLRTDSAKSYVMASHQLQEIKGSQFLDNYLAGKISDADRALIAKLRKNGISDYEIAFWIQYQPSEVGGVIGAWKNINNKINLVLGG